MFQAKDIMTTQLVTVGTDETIDAAIDLMLEHHISGLPVLDPQGHPVGVVSEFDLLELVCEGQGGDAQVRDYMSPEFFTVTADDTWVTIADTMRSKHVRRLPVMQDGALVGIVSCRDLVHAVRDARQHLRQTLAHRTG